MYHFEKKSELRDALQGRRVRAVEFGSGGVGVADQRSVALHLDDGSSVVISATSFGTLEFEG